MSSWVLSTCPSFLSLQHSKLWQEPKNRLDVFWASRWETNRVRLRKPHWCNDFCFSFLWLKGWRSLRVSRFRDTQWEVDPNRSQRQLHSNSFPELPARKLLRPRLHAVTLLISLPAGLVTAGYLRDFASFGRVLFMAGYSPDFFPRTFAWWLQVYDWTLSDSSVQPTFQENQKNVLDKISQGIHTFGVASSFCFGSHSDYWSRKAFSSEVNQGQIKTYVIPTGNYDLNPALFCSCQQIFSTFLFFLKSHKGVGKGPTISTSGFLIELQWK